jgi:UDP-glucose 4-epimerase
MFTRALAVHDCPSLKQSLAGLMRAVLAVLHPLGVSRYGPEQVDFLRYRPVLDNRRLKEVFGYVPRLTSAEVFELYRKSHGLGPA